MRVPAESTAATTFICITAVLDIAAMGMVLPILPILIKELVGANAEAGTINGLFVALWALMQFIAAPLIGSLSDQYGRRPAVIVSTAGLAIHYAILALAPDLWWLALGRVIAGATSSSFMTAYAYIADITPPEKRSRAYGVIGAAFGGGYVAGPLIGGMLVEVSPRAPFWIASALCAAAFCYGMRFLPESLAVERRTNFSWKRANPVGALQLLRSQGLRGLALITFLLYFAHHAFTAVFVLYASFRQGLSAWEIGALFAVMGVLDVIVQGIVVGPLIRRLGDEGTMIFGLFVGAVGIACVALAPTGLLLCLALVPAALRGLAAPTLRSVMTQRVSGSAQGQLQGAIVSLGNVAAVLSPPFFGLIYTLSTADTQSTPHHSGAAFLVASLVLSAAGIAGWRMGWRQSASAVDAGETAPQSCRPASAGRL